MARKLLSTLAVLSLSLWMSAAHALLTISNVSYTTHSVTFTIDGDMTGYTAPPTSIDQFSLLYTDGGNIWQTPGIVSSALNNWSRSVFDNKTIVAGGTGGYSAADDEFTAARFSEALNDATVSNATVTVDFTNDYLNLAATNPTITFVWGNGGILTRTVIQRVTATPIDTATLTLLKTVVNDEGGTAVDTDFTLTATGPDVISGVEGDASITSAVVAVGNYALTESTLAGYTLAGWSCTSGLSGSAVTLIADDVVTCTVTNTDDTPVVEPLPLAATPIPTMSAYGLVLIMLGLLLVASRRLRASDKRT